MKIGAFAKRFDVSVDTVRYYIEIELLLPDKKASAHYEFTPSCVEDMAFISEMKQFHFTLQEIRQMLLRKRISDFTVFEDIRWHYLRMMNEKKQRLMKDKEQLENALHRLENKLISLQDEPRTEAETGVPYSFLPLLYCPSCRIPLQIRNACLQGNICLAHNYTAPALIRRKSRKAFCLPRIKKTLVPHIPMAMSTSVFNCFHLLLST